MDLLAVQGTLKNLLQHHSSKAQGRANTKVLRWEHDVNTRGTRGSRCGDMGGGRRQRAVRRWEMRIRKREEIAHMGALRALDFASESKGDDKPLES